MTATDLEYVLSDQQGSTMAVLNSTGAMIANSEKRYLPFGDVRTDLTISNQTDFGYTGQREVEGSEMMDYNARFLNPGLSRFTQPDMVVQNIANPQTLNRYSYVGNNPIRYTDPTGHAFEDEAELPDDGCELENDPSCQSEEDDGGDASGGGSNSNTETDLDEVLKKQYIDLIFENFGVIVTSNSDVSWTLAQVKIIWAALKDLGRKLAKVMGMNDPGKAFMKVFGTASNPITFKLTSESCGCWGQTFYSNSTKLIKFYSDGSFTLNKGVIIHELGHYFDHVIGENGADTYLQWGDAPDGNECFGGTRGQDWFGNTSTTPAIHSNEKFADMFQAWLYPGSFTSDLVMGTKCRVWIGRFMGSTLRGLK